MRFLFIAVEKLEEAGRICQESSFRDFTDGFSPLRRGQCVELAIVRELAGDACEEH
jgi:hypothetical protein